MKLDNNFLEAIGMHSMTKADQKKALSQLAHQANEDSRKQAVLDPISRIPRA